MCFDIDPSLGTDIDVNEHPKHRINSLSCFNCDPSLRTVIDVNACPKHRVKPCVVDTDLSLGTVIECAKDRVNTCCC